MLFCTGCSQIQSYAEKRSIRATRQAELYPWIYYPISEESKAALCEVLELPDNDGLCWEGIPILHQYVVEKIKDTFPEKHTSYSEVEAKLGDFPHSVERIRQPDGTLIVSGYVYRLTEYKGACITFLISQDDNEIVEKIISSGLGSGPSPTTCGP